MAKLTKAQRNQIGSALGAICAVRDMLKNETYSVCRRSRSQNALTFTRNEVPAVLRTARDDKLGNYGLEEICVEIGSDLARLPDAIRILADMLQNAEGI